MKMIDMNAAFDWEMAKLRFRGNKLVARRWLAWHNANQPKLWDHIKRLWITLNERKRHGRFR